MDNLKEEALDMYFYKGKSLEVVCKKMDIDKEKLIGWIIKTCKGKDRTAIYMFFSLFLTKEKICNDLDITISQLNSWIDRVYDTKSNIAIFRKSKKQLNKLDWVNKIFDEVS